MNYLNNKFRSKFGDFLRNIGKIYFWELSIFSYGTDENHFFLIKKNHTSFLIIKRESISSKGGFNF